jgi:hypothetical protein
MATAKSVTATAESPFRTQMAMAFVTATKSSAVKTQPLATTTLQQLTLDLVSMRMATVRFVMATAA